MGSLRYKPKTNPMFYANYVILIWLHLQRHLFLNEATCRSTGSQDFNTSLWETQFNPGQGLGGNGDKKEFGGMLCKAVSAIQGDHHLHDLPRLRPPTRTRGQTLTDLTLLPLGKGLEKHPFSWHSDYLLGASGTLGRGLRPLECTPAQPAGY